MGNFLEDLLSKVFKGSEKIPVNHKENFTLKPADLDGIDQWIYSSEGMEVFGKIYKNYHFKKSQINDSPQVHLLESPYANGFAVTYDHPLTPESFSKLFLAFSRRVLALGYQQVSLDRKIEEINEQVRTTEKFYLKPPIQAPLPNEKITQLYGNVSIEKISINNQPSYLKLVVTVYSDRLYQDAMPFEQLMDKVFNLET
ncbi:hypothetical protein [Algoriphagus hitonicola]|uniref:Uncharacterized protein n=1 Tax=Algoriphagus hitonicola TaxID=435880 RepID=A0A1I2WA69_9BACT|nr:hypothetical protein [Algoriphagus hitonicola]SFG98314.1 hypothetical protein SAMN04487988_11231 [Algoriphagus hitonicola]